MSLPEAVELDPLAILPGDDPEPVMLDLVHPRLAGGRGLGLGGRQSERSRGRQHERSDRTCGLDRRARPGMGRGIVSMVIGTSTIVFAAAAAVGVVVFAFAPPADARFMHQCSGKYEAAAKAGCGVNAAKARPPRPRGITLGIGDVVSITIFEPPGGLFVPSDAGARPGNFVTLPNQIGLQRQHSSAVRAHE